MGTETVTKYTVTCDYMATGEGHTMTILYIFASSPEDALLQFKREVTNGDWFSLGAEVKIGFDFDNYIAQQLVSPAVRRQLEDENCNRHFVAQLHYNYR